MTDYQAIFNQSGAEMSAEAQRVIDGARQQAAAFRDAANTTIARAMDRKGLSDRARQAVAARTYRQNQAQQEKLFAEHIAGINRHRQQLIDRAFGARGGDGQTLMARRQAQSMAAGLDEPWKAMDLLKTAQQDGDAQLAQVVAGHAYSRGWTDVVDQWNHDGSNDRAMRNLLEAQQLPDTNDIAWRMSASAEFYAEKPAILDGLREQEIDTLSRDDLGDAA
ncbi:hypothetical protein ABT269_05560 [Streptomyces viridosporus]|uniref:hypothetical protein n=1 Tax=Streptomyces viridosporus TaxID=67581 RepID=UPI003318ED32